MAELAHGEAQAECESEEEQGSEGGDHGIHACSRRHYLTADPRSRRRRDGATESRCYRLLSPLGGTVDGSHDPRPASSPVIEASADVTVPVGADEAYAALSDLEHADWLPAVRGLRHVGGPAQGVGARYEVEAGLVGRHLRGVLVCVEAKRPDRTVMTLEDGLDLTIIATVQAVSGGCRVELTARYTVGNGLTGLAVERASAGAARREVCRAVEHFAAQFGRKAAASG